VGGLTVEVSISMINLSEVHYGMDYRLIEPKKVIEADEKSRVHLVFDPFKGEIP